jgi:DNA modification methylase
MSLVRADARSIPLRDGCVQCVVTSPPYFGLRDYGVAGQIGLEQTPDAYVAELVAVFREVRRVMRDDAVLFLNLGDSYNGSGGFAPDAPCNQKRAVGDAEAWGKFHPHGMDRMAAKGVAKRIDTLKPKDLIGIPWRVAFALQADGWYLRADIIWHKPNPMPESVTDRPTKAHEYVFLLTKNARYWWDAEAISEPASQPQGFRYQGGYRDMLPHVEDAKRVNVGNSRTATGAVPHFAAGLGENRNVRSVWTIPTQPYAAAHFATFPEALAERCIKAGSKPGLLVFDPFGGSGTVAQVARRLNRRAVCTELNPTYLALAKRRIAEQQVEPFEVVA